MPLPIYDIEEQIVTSLARDKRLILSAPTGSGKSTQVPQMLLKHGLLELPDGSPGQVVILQPRRIAARLLAARVAQELGVQLGKEAGYQIRFENVTSRETRIRFVTEGVLLRQMIDNPSLPGIAAILFDEFHERHLYGDITLARALDIQESNRPDLQLAVTSATLDSKHLERYLAAASNGERRPCSVVQSEGRTFPVEVHYSRTPAPDHRTPLWEQAADAFSHYVQTGGEGDVLVFMPGGYEISRTLEAIRHRKEAKGFRLLPLHGELNPRDQDAAVARYEERKVVVSTNVAETSLTIDGIRLVIDSGLARIPRFDPYRGINTLLIDKISRANAEQRSGRAGRTAPGVCYRLWTEREHSQRPVQELPEVQRLDLSEVVLTLKAAGVEDLDAFRWLKHPGRQRLDHSETLLTDLGALKLPTAANRTTASDLPKPTTEITDAGRRMLAFPLHPRHARMLLAADELGCVYHACLVAALTQGRDLLLRKVEKESKHRREDKIGDRSTSDFFIHMRAWEYAADNQFRLDACKEVGIHAVTARQVAPLLQQFLRIAEREGLDTAHSPLNEVALRQCILIGFSDRVARRLDSGTLRCELVHGRRGLLARESAVQNSPLLVAAEIREVGRHGGDSSTLLSQATAIEEEWLASLFPGDVRTEVQCHFDPKAKRVYAAEKTLFRDLELNARPVEPPPAEQAASILAEEITAGRLQLKHWDHGVDQWILRVNWLSQWCPELELPSIGDAEKRSLIEQICHGAFTFKDVRETHVKPLVRDWLNPMQQQLLDQHAPERIEMPNGKRPKVTYTEDGRPFISMRIQELFDIRKTPCIAMGRVPVLLHILAPNMRPVQITQDLAGFWKEHYPRVKSELQRKYPKHEWR